MNLTLGDWLWAIPVFGLLIFIHELGHFAVAKYFDIRVHEFALGFGPAVTGFQKGETRYNLRLVPLGGFVRMAGMEEGDAEDPRGFNRKPLLARSLVIFAGPFMNFVLASLLFSGYLYSVGTLQPVLSDVPATCLTADAAAPAVPCPAATAGLQKGDRILAVNARTITEWREVTDLIKASGGKAVVLSVQRDGNIRNFTLTPVFVPSENRYMVGISPSYVPEPLGRAFLDGPVYTVNISVAWLGGLVDMVAGRVQPQIAGPVGITREIAENAAQGWDALLGLTAFLSINLGMFNLLPIPALDGSRLVFMVVEAVRGRRVDPQRENMVHFVGFLILIGLMVVLTYGEVVRR